MTQDIVSSSALDPLMPYQANVVAECLRYNVTVIEKSRRIGISWVLSWLAVTVAASSKSAGGMDVFYMGYEKNMTRQFIDDCAEHALMLTGATVDVQEDLFRDPDNPDKDIQVYRIKFASGYEILALPSVPRAFRSKQGLVILDEAAFVDDLKAMIKAALALRIWGAKIIILSTHKGASNPFNDLINEVRSGKKPYHLMRITFNDAVEQGLYRKICQKLGEEWTPEKQQAWYDEIIAEFAEDADEELHVIPSEGGGAYLPLSWIERSQIDGAVVVRWKCDNDFANLELETRAKLCNEFCIKRLLPLLEQLDAKTPHAAGEDFARTGDLTVIWILAILANLMRKTRFTVELRNVPFEQQRQVLWFIFDRLPLFRAAKLDARGNGQWLAEVTAHHYGERVEAVMLSDKWYRENMPQFRAAFEDGTILTPKDRETEDDLRAIELIDGVAKIPKKRSLDTDKKSKRHGDAAIAAALAYAASRAEPGEYGYRAAPSPYANAADDERRSGAWPLQQEIAEERSRRRTGLDTYGIRGRLM